MDGLRCRWSKGLPLLLNRDNAREAKNTIFFLSKTVSVSYTVAKPKLFLGEQRLSATSSPGATTSAGDKPQES